MSLTCVKGRNQRCRADLADSRPSAGQDQGFYITENGASFTDVIEDGKVHDPLRIAFLESYMEAATQAIRDGVNLHGYFIWSLMDNFEWREGFSKRFGLVYVDHATQQRTIKDSGRWLAELIREQNKVKGSMQETNFTHCPDIGISFGR